MDKLFIQKCCNCSKYTFPQKFFCSECGSTEFNKISIDEGKVKEISVIRHMLGQKDWIPRKIANIETALGIMRKEPQARRAKRDRCQYYS